MGIFSRAKHFGERILREGGAFPPRLREFGFKVAAATFVDGLAPPEKKAFYIRTIEEYVDRFMEPVVEKYRHWTKDQLLPRPAGKIPVWCCWWQGEESMPELVRLCNARLRQLFPHEEAELHLLTQDNYQDYVPIPAHILEKVQSGKITITALSDYLRAALLAKYGGFWIDATVFISDFFPMEFLRNDYYAQRMYDPVKWQHEACKGRWCGFCQGGSPGNIMFLVLRDGFDLWWRTHDSVVDYVLIDYILLSGYKGIPAFREQVDALPDNNTDIFEMYKVLHLPYTPERYAELTKTTNLHKLTYKIDLYKQTPAGEKTLYGHLLEQVFGEDGK